MQNSAHTQCTSSLIQHDDRVWWFIESAGSSDPTKR